MYVFFFIIECLFFLDFSIVISFFIYAIISIDYDRPPPKKKLKGPSYVSKEWHKLFNLFNSGYTSISYEISGNKLGHV